jgi:5-methylcytosine-specific restriction endonuclease McrA
MSAAPLPGMRPWSGRYRQEWTRRVLAHYGRRCHLCGQPGATTADHLTPRSQGGLDSLGNLRPAHHVCNSMRGTKSLAEWFAAHPLPRRPTAQPSREW